MQLRCHIAAREPYQSRARYALETLLYPLGLEPVWTDSHAADLMYGNEPVEGGPLFFRLEEETARFFEGDPRPGLPPVAVLRDPIASSFFWLSGWQEIASVERDVHGRFPVHASIPQDVLEPPVDRAREQIAARLQEKGIELSRRRWNGRKWAFCPTHDVDYTRKFRPGILYRDLVQYPLQGRGARRLGQSIRQLAGPDPYRRALKQILKEEERHGAKATWFFKTAAHGTHDVSYRLPTRFLSELQALGHEIGLHPTYFAGTYPDYLEQERDRLTLACGHAPVSVRQHYLRFDPAVTPRLQESAGFAIDSSLGWAEREGFRRGTCLPFRLFDLRANRPLDVWEMPLAVMESALFNRRGYSLEEAVAATEEVMQSCRRFGGVCVVLWHNMLWDELDAKGWGEHFLRVLGSAVRQEAFITSLSDALSDWRS